MSDIQAIVLAAGKGTRMRSSLPKVLHELAGKPMLVRILDTLARAGFACPLVVVDAGESRVRHVIGDRVHYVDQGERRGTGGAAAAALAALPPATSRVLIVHGDEPLIEAATYQEMLARQDETGAPIVLLTTHARDLRGFGRVIRGRDGRIEALVQEGDLTAEQRTVTEVNLGAYVICTGFLRGALERLRPHPPKGEYYLTDVIHEAVAAGETVEAITVPGGEEIMGINDLSHLEHATRAIYRATARRLMAAGVTILDTASTFVGDDVRIGSGTILSPFTIIEGNTVIGEDCVIGPSAHIVSSRLGDRCQVLSSTVRDSSLADDVRVGPYAHVRDGAVIGPHCEILTHAEIKGSRLGPGTKMHHFGYVGDAEIGANVNIGAGVVTCNFDGRTKHRTIVGNGAFLGSDTMLRAPITIGDNAATGAGSVVTHDVPANTTVAGVPARPLTSPESGERGEG
ncbi:MAG TPA: bifunctional UDP-N-acetylglucosamine diphosphorylase/glucosamine-1-phosphate N-acetyltransferase GlmU [Chloroflexota bacterium]|nr:bifunctional UDP-N-acetylglucosamine diphosphorylase/glucosamine-1-phosphate N-acetyltransferase GlmU [Chloroflexota bacterium]